MEHHGVVSSWMPPEAVDATVIQPLAPSDKLRRIEIVRALPNGADSVTGCGRFCDLNSLPFPSAQTYAKLDRFWFTPEGWVRYGRGIFVKMMHPGELRSNERVIVRERFAEMADGESFSYEDRFQVAIRKPISRRTRRKSG